MNALLKKLFLFIGSAIVVFNLSLLSVVVAQTTTSSPSPTITPTITPTSTPGPTQNPTPTPIGTCNDVAPAAPTLISADSGGAHSIVLKWGEVTDSVSYYLVSYGVASGNYIYGNPNVGNVTTYTVGSLATGKTYYFAVKAVNGCMPGTYSNELSGVPGSSTPTPTSQSADEEVSPTEGSSPTEQLSPAKSAPITPVPQPGAVNVEKTLVYSVIGVLLLVSVIALILINRSARKPKKPQPPMPPPEPPIFDQPQSPPPVNSIS
jgi:hypothetical protein